MLRSRWPASISLRTKNLTQRRNCNARCSSIRQASRRFSRWGRCSRSQGRTDEADRTYRTVAALPKTNLSFVHAAFLLQQGKRAEAIAEFEKLAAANPKDRATALRLISADITAGRGTEATRHLDEMLKRDPKDSDALLMKSRIDLRFGRALDAERDLERALHFNSESADAHYGMAQVDFILGRQRGRKHELTEVIRLAPNLIGPRVDLARDLIAEGQAEAALQTMDEGRLPTASRRSPASSRAGTGRCSH